ncbi:uncharacterized protein LOC132047885 [Lycium ferocissimum]|uniref:uncharacterized protein LOC132047885 n=1 Tax=Lycium ferocissimum TaxID=112874 RepID=UPI00281566D7|nr:uncharacterized protein LOC132047885 [Lycium ferocissimum]
MVSLNFIRLVLVALLVLHQHSSAHDLFGKLRKKEWLEFTTIRKDHDSVSVDGIIGSSGGIRKMLVYQFSGKVVKQEHIAYGRASHMNADQVDSQIFEKNTRNSQGTVHFLDQQNHERSKKEESKEYVYAEDEVAKLMSRDYSERSGPRRKPPINNHKLSNHKTTLIMMSDTCCRILPK